jgi:hypothetical protein
MFIVDSGLTGCDAVSYCRWFPEFFDPEGGSGMILWDVSIRP